MKRQIKAGQDLKAGPIKRLLRNLFCFPAWFMPHKKLRAIFHKLKGVRIGKGVEIGYMVFTDNRRPELITIEDGATVTSNCTILSHDLSRRRIDDTEIIGEVRIKKDAFIGMNSTIMPGVTIGKKSIVGVNAVVTKDVPDNTTVIGIPARPIK